MDRVSDAVKNALNEARTLILCTQVLLGFQLQSVLEPRFERLPVTSQWLTLAGLAVLILAFALLAAPAAHHQIVDRGGSGREIQTFTTGVLAAALLPLALAFGLATYIITERIDIGVRPLVAAAIVFAVAVGGWYVWPLARRPPRRAGEPAAPERDETPIADKIEHVLTELRVVLPGAQALLGFGFTAVLTERFERLPHSSQLVHLAGVAFVMLATIFLMTPAARHRLAEHGANTEAFHRSASRMLLLGMAALAVGVAAQAFVVVRRVVESVPVAGAAAGVSLALCFGVWFGLSMWLRHRRARREPVSRARAARRAA